MSLTQTKESPEEKARKRKERYQFLTRLHASIWESSKTQQSARNPKMPSVARKLTVEEIERLDEMVRSGEVFVQLVTAMHSLTGRFFLPPRTRTPLSQEDHQLVVSEEHHSHLFWKMVLRGWGLHEGNKELMNRHDGFGHRI